jgi:NAD(P)-dependent dehydrogenase (short-subunit alcohol dehydrogenase family)
MRRKIIKILFFLFLTISQVEIYNSFTYFKGVMMKDFKGKVAVVTGAASGIGYGLAERAAKEGMKVVLADVEEGALGKAEKLIESLGVEVLSVKTDVSKADDVKALVKKTIDTFGAVHLLCNNAGVSAGTTAWQSTLADWRWVLGVNLWGVIYGIHFFVPVMLKQDTECHIVNTASVAGLIGGNGNDPYTVSKHGVVALSEALYRELEQAGSNIGVSVLCPGIIDTNILESERNRPAELQNALDTEQMDISDPKVKAMLQNIKEIFEKGMKPAQVADIVFNAIREKKFYLLPNGEIFKPVIQMRLDDISRERNPTTVQVDLA